MLKEKYALNMQNNFPKKEIKILIHFTFYTFNIVFYFAIYFPMLSRVLITGSTEELFKGLTNIVEPNDKVELQMCTQPERAFPEIIYGQFDLVVIDVAWPFNFTLSFSEQIRKASQIPIIIVADKTDKKQRIDSFRLGCDDLMVSPISHRELLLRIKAVIKRSKN